MFLSSQLTSCAREVTNDLQSFNRQMQSILGSPVYPVIGMLLSADLHITSTEYMQVISAYFVGSRAGFGANVLLHAVRWLLSMLSREIRRRRLQARSGSLIRRVKVGRCVCLPSLSYDERVAKQCI